MSLRIPSLLAATLVVLVSACGAPKSDQSGLLGGESVNNGVQLRSHVKVVLQEVIPTKIISAVLTDVSPFDGSIDQIRCERTQSLDVSRLVCESDAYRFEQTRVATGLLTNLFTDKARGRRFDYACKKPEGQTVLVDVAKLFECEQKRVAINAQ